MKKYPMLLLFFAVVFTFSGPVFALPGDVTGDEKVDIADVIRGLQIIDRAELSGQTININADVNINGQIGLEEVIYILQMAAGLRIDTSTPAAVIASVRPPAPGDIVVLDGTYSIDPQAGDLTYSWTQVSGTGITLDGAASDTAFFTAPDTEGDLVFQLTVTTTKGYTHSSQVTVTVISTPPPQSSTALIQADLDGGKLTAEQGLIYKVFAAFGDSRLPRAYQGDGTVPPEGTSVMDQLDEGYDSLSAETQAIVYPFLMPPYMENSWYDQRNNPQSTTSSPSGAARVPLAAKWESKSNGNVKVWYEAGYGMDYGAGPLDFGVIADEILKAVDTKIWNKLQTLMGKVPPSDLNAKLPSIPPGLGFNPGNLDQDGRLDIILCRGIGPITKTFGNKPSPSFILINIEEGPIGDELTPGLVQTVAHELMHAWQNSYPIKDASKTYKWLKEATAKWAEDYTYKDANSERSMTKPYFDTMNLSIDKTDDQREYGAYTAFSYWTNSTCCGGDTNMKQIWEAVGTKSSIDAVDAANPVPYGDMLPHSISSFWERYWGDFLVAAWNYGADGYFREKDGTTDTPKVRDAVDVKAVPGSKAYRLDTIDPDGKIELPYLSARYYYFLFSDDAARSVMFFDGLRATLKDQEIKKSSTGSTNGYRGTPLTPGYTDPAEGATWRILVKIDGKWQDWTDTSLKRASTMLTFCRDAKKERIQALAVALGNSSPTKENFVQAATGGLAPIVYVSNMGCWRWEGDVTVDTGKDDEIKVTSKTHVVLANAGELAGAPVSTFGNFAVLSATTTTTVSGTTFTGDSKNNTTCTYSGSGTIPWSRKALLAHEFKMIPFATSGELYRKSWFENSGSVGQQIEYTANCTITSTHIEIDPITGKDVEVTETSSSTGKSSLTPDVWPAGLSVIKAEIGDDGSTISGNLTAPNGDRYQWSLRSQRE